MGCIKEENLARVDDILSGIAKNFTSIHLETIPFKKGRASIRIEKSRDIELMHELVMIRLSPFFNYNITKDMVYNSQNEEIAEITYDYIAGFLTKSSFENYVPHITVGVGEADMEMGSFEFDCRELALCHLGNYCTCRKIILSHHLAMRKAG